MATPIGEDSWLAYLEEKARSAADLEQHVDLIELHKRSVSAEPGSLRLWLAYCSYFQTLWERSKSDDSGWSEEEQAIGQEIFSFKLTVDLWQEGYASVQFRFGDSQELWDRWISLERKHFDKAQHPEQLQRIMQLFRDRLFTPHWTWEATSQAFSGFLSEYNEAAWEDTLKDITAGAQKTKRAIELRDPFEIKLKQAERSGDLESQKTLLWDYLDWEVRRNKRENKDDEGVSWKLCSGLFDRALTGILAKDDDAWHEYIVFLSASDRSLSAARRAVEHCPSSGRLWARYILCAEEERLPWEEVKSIKDSALQDGQLCRDGMENMLLMHAAWCAYLKRESLATTASEDLVNGADGELKLATENVKATGRRLYGPDFQGDPAYRLERIRVQFLTEKEAIDEARAIWKALARKGLYADSHDFWINYYAWEMRVFSNGRSHQQSSITPAAATAVLRIAATRKSVDWPEKILDVYSHHCNLYETCDVVRQAQNFVHVSQKILRRRRKQEEETAQAAQYAAYYEAQEQAQAQGQDKNLTDVTAESQTRAEHHSQEQPTASETTTSPSAPKRKYEKIPNDQLNEVEQSSKRQRNGEETSSATEGQPVKRDREHSTVIVTNLPPNTTRSEVTKYFRPYGVVKNITALVKNEEKNSTTALIEFHTAEEALSALLRNDKFFGESQITVKPGQDLTIYVANFPPLADEQFIRDLFKDCGEILSIRWPSLKVNTHRRFCYISFLDQTASAKAVAKEGKLIERKYRLLAKYSDPNRKKDREGATAEGREVHISNLPRSATEAALREVFGAFGTITGVRIPQNMAGHNLSYAFLDFATKEQAAKAAQELNHTNFRGNILQVQVSKEAKIKRTAKTTVSHHASASPAPADTVMNDAPASTTSDIDARTIALMGFPDTINDVRVRALVEPLGSIVKLVHQPSHGGAVIEFADAVTAGKAALQLNTMRYEGHQLRTGSPSDLKNSKPAPDTPKPKVAFNAAPRIVRRPASGPKRGLGAPRKSAPPGPKKENDAGDTAASAKSNSDFRTMFLGSAQGSKESE